MASISRTDYGLIAVNNRVLYKMIVQEIIAMGDSLIPCNKKGKLIKKRPTPFIDPDLYDSIEIIEEKNEFVVNVYTVIKFGLSISETCNVICDKVEKCFELLGLDTPEIITINVKGLMSKQLVRRDIKVNRVKSSDD